MNTLELTAPETKATHHKKSGADIIRFPFGLIGFEAVKNYSLLVNPKENPFMTLQMAEGDKYSFRVVPAAIVLPDYQPDINDRDVEFLGLTQPDDALVFVIVNLRADGATVNLKAPLVLNRHRGIGKQVIPVNAAQFDQRHSLGREWKAKLNQIRATPGSKPALAGKTPPVVSGKSRESALAHRYLDGLRGLEIGGSAHNPFGLATRNVDYCADLNTMFKEEEMRKCGEMLKVDIVAPGDELPLPDASEDFVVSSHVIEHFFDPIKAIEEWLRVIRPGGYILIIAPHKDRTFDRDRPRTTLQELLDRHSGKIPRPAVDTHEHYSVWITQDLLDLCREMKWNVVAFQNADDKVGNGFLVLIQKPTVASN